MYVDLHGPVRMEFGGQYIMNKCKNKILACLSSSVQFSRSVVSDSLKPHELQHARLPYPSPSPGVCSNSLPLSR